MKCRACLAEDFMQILDFGSMPLINNFLSEKNQPEQQYALNLVKCKNCHLVQLEETVDPDILFKDYVYVPSSSATIMNHFKDLTKKALELVKSKDPFIVEIASNDGSLLQNVKGKKILGIEPATNIAKMAVEKGIPTLNRFFNAETAALVTKKHGKADLIIGTNVLAHVPEIWDFITGVKVMAKSRESRALSSFRSRDQRCGTAGRACRRRRTLSAFAALLWMAAALVAAGEKKKPA